MEGPRGRACSDGHYVNERVPRRTFGNLTATVDGRPDVARATEQQERYGRTDGRTNGPRRGRERELRNIHILCVCVCVCIHKYIRVRDVIERESGEEHEGRRWRWRR